MKLVHIGYSNSKTKIINLNELKDQEENDFELPPDPENNLVFDPRPIYYNGSGSFYIEIQDSARLVVTRTDDERGSKFDIEIQVSARLVVTRTDDDNWWDALYFRVYDRTKEDVPAGFDSSVPYDYWGLNKEWAPIDSIVVRVRHAVTTIRKNAFLDCYKMTSFDMSNAPIEEIEDSAFFRCKSVRSILFSQVLEKIGLMAFYKCEGLDILVVPSTVTNIGRCAFGICTNMRILKLPDDIDLDYVADDIIENCFALLDKVPPNQTHKQWLKHRYDPYPLHKVCYNAHVTVEEIQQCILAHPHVAYLSDEFHMTALHMITIMVCTSNLHVHTQSHNHDHDQGEGATCLLGGTGHITACFEANMSAAFVGDDRGKTPLDYLLESCDGLDVHTTLVTSLCLHRIAYS